MLSEEQAAKHEQVIGLSTIEEFCRKLGHAPDRVISISMDYEYVHTDFMTMGGKRVTESMKIIRAK